MKKLAHYSQFKIKHKTNFLKFKLESKLKSSPEFTTKQNATSSFYPTEQAGLNSNLDSPEQELFEFDSSETNETNNKSFEMHHDANNMTNQDLLGDSWHCKSCGKHFSTKQNLNNHVLAIHRNEKPFQCTLCDKKFTQNISLKTHIRSIHFNQKPFECSLCHKTFKQNIGLQIHIKGVHNKETPFECYLCNKKFTQNANLKTHLKTIHNKDKTV